jgi:hypothetical protein
MSSDLSPQHSVAYPSQDLYWNYHHHYQWQEDEILSNILLLMREEAPQGATSFALG